MSERRTLDAARAEPALATAALRKERRHSLAWIVPVAALVLAAWLVASAWRQRGVAVTVLLPAGHGLKVGDAARARGIAVGEIEDVRLAQDLGSVQVTVRLRAEGDRLARAGTRFWVVRPRLRLTGVEGLETLVGPQYLAVSPASGAEDAPRQREFVGLVEPPVVEHVDPEDLEIILEATRRGSLQPGAPVHYRQMPVGTVLSVGLASDGSIVEARAHVRKAYRGLVRRGTRFWDAGGVRTEIGLSGWSVELDSLEGLIQGGVAFATPEPDDAGDAVRTGHRFTLHERADDEWLEWQPNVAIGSSLLPPGASLPHPLLATVAWRQGFIIKGARSRRGWVLETEEGLLGPADLLVFDDVDPETASLEIAGRALPLTTASTGVAPGVVVLLARVAENVWPAERTRAPDAPEDAIAVGDAGAAPLPLAASRLAPEDDGWRVDAAISMGESWHGASVLSRADGRLIGVLLVEDDRTRVVPLPEGRPN